MLAIAMLLYHQGIVQRRGVVTVQRLVMRGRHSVMLAHTLKSMWEAITEAG